MEASLKSRKRKDYKSLNTSCPKVVTRSRRRLNLDGDRSDRLELLKTTGGGGNGGFEYPALEDRTPVDLRAHRIFSPVSVGSSDEKDIDVPGDYSSAEDGEEDREEEISGVGEVRTVSVGQNGRSEPVEEAVQEAFQSTPPEAMLGEARIMESFDKINDPLPKGYNQQSPGGRSPRSRTLKPCSRPRLFGNPSSFNYKRLIPYLMDMTKGAFKSLDLKPHLPKSAETAVDKSFVSTLEPNSSFGTQSSMLQPELSPSMTSETNLICIENTADAKVPANSCFKEQEALVSLDPCDLTHGLTNVSTDTSDELSHIDLSKAMVLDGIAESDDGKNARNSVSSEPMIDDSIFVDPATQQSPDENRSELVDVFDGAPSCKLLGVVGSHAAEIISVNYEKPQRETCAKNYSDVVQETPLINEICGRKDVNGKPECQIEDATITKKDFDHEQFAASEDATTLGGDSSCINYPAQQSPDEYRSEMMNVFGDVLSCELLDLGNVDEAENYGVNQDKPPSKICCQNPGEIFQETSVMNEESGNQSVISTVVSISKPDNGIYGGIITNSSDCEQSFVSADKKHSSSSETEKKLHLKPRRQKIFKISNSVNYRRMLPYLKEIHGASASPSSVKVTKVENGIAKDYCTVTLVKDTAWPDDSNPISAISSVVEPELSDFGHSSEFDATGSPIETKLENTLKSPVDLQISSHDQGPPIQFAPSSSGSICLHIGQCDKKSQSTPSSFKEEATVSKIKHGSDDSLYLNEDAILLKPIGSLEKPFVGPSRCILKRNPRGCRGLCSCLKCASFRLNAEKAFEFSRNQLLYSEEIALKLINELSLLRNLLMQSTDEESGKPSQVQVQEACGKAYAVEQQAKAQFEQMNSDLHIHCRIPNLQKPTVSFARHSMENIIQTAHRSSKLGSP